VPDYYFKKCPKGFNKISPRLLYVGRLSHEKGVMKIPELVEVLSRREVKFKLKIIGEGPCKKELHKKCPDAEFLEYRKRSDLIQFYQESDLLIFPSGFDAFGATMLEAMSCGLPVAAFKSKASLELIKNPDQGILVDTIEEMAEKIYHVFKEKESMVNMSENAFQRSTDFNEKGVIYKLQEDLGLKSDLKSKTIAV
jgi:glycosyltransferase involved in cell wall biosynthesis